MTADQNAVARNEMRKTENEYQRCERRSQIRPRSAANMDMAKDFFTNA